MLLHLRVLPIETFASSPPPAASVAGDPATDQPEQDTGTDDGDRDAHDDETESYQIVHVSRAPYQNISCCDIFAPMSRRAGTGRRFTPRVDYETLAELRHHIRRFLRLREEAARAAGVEPQQYVLLLQVKGLARRGPVTIGGLAERLQIRHHATVQLVDRLARKGMVRRRRAQSDRREVIVEITARGETVLRRLALYSLTELRTEGPALATTLTRLIGHTDGARRPRAEPQRLTPTAPVRRTAQKDRDP